MWKRDIYEFPSKGAWRAMKEIKDRELYHLNISTGVDTTILDTQLSLNLRWIPRIFTAPFQAVGLVTSIFARTLNTRITLHVKDNEE